MPIFSSGKSWGNQGKDAGGLFHPEKKCPPIEDCSVKNFVIAGKRVKARGKKEIAKAEAAVKKEKAEARAEAKKVRSNNSWPFKGSYDPKKGKK